MTKTRVTMSFVAAVTRLAVVESAGPWFVRLAGSVSRNALPTMARGGTGAPTPRGSHTRWSRSRPPSLQVRRGVRPRAGFVDVHVSRW